MAEDPGCNEVPQGSARKARWSRQMKRQQKQRWAIEAQQSIVHECLQCGRDAHFAILRYEIACQWCTRKTNMHHICQDCALIACPTCCAE